MTEYPSFPKKCLACIRSGLLFCRYWFSGFSCELFDKNETLKELERLL